MSMRIATTFANELNAPDAIHKIVEMHYVAPSSFTVVVGIWAHEQARRDRSKPCVEFRSFTINDFDVNEVGNLHTRMYRWLKMQPEYTGVYRVTEEITVGYVLPTNTVAGFVVTPRDLSAPWVAGEDYVVEDGVVTHLAADRRPVRIEYAVRRHEPAVDT